MLNLKFSNGTNKVIASYIFPFNPASNLIKWNCKEIYVDEICKREGNMAEYIIDFALVSFLVIGLTAVMGPLTNMIGSKLFSRNKNTEFVDQSNLSSAGFKPVGGKKY